MMCSSPANVLLCLNQRGVTQRKHAMGAAIRPGNTGRPANNKGENADINTKRVINK